MKNQVKTLVLAAVLCVSALGYADSSDPLVKKEQKTTPEQRIEKRIEKMKKNLNISDAQATEIRSLLTNSKTQLQDRIAKMKAAPEADRALLRNDIKSSRISTHNQILHILTPEQRAKAETLREAKKDKIKEKRQHRRNRR